MHTNTPTSEVYNMDCLAAMREMPDNAFDLAIVDPPYGISASEMQLGTGKNKLYKKEKNGTIVGRQINILNSYSGYLKIK